MTKFSFFQKSFKSFGGIKRRDIKFNDIYWDLFERSEMKVLEDLNQIFDLNLKNTEELFLSKFEHIMQTGGSNVNDTFRYNAAGDILQIPGYEQVWNDPRTARSFTPLTSKKVISAHYLHGTKIESDLPVKSFSFIRDPRKLIISAIQDPIYLKSDEGLDAIWKRVENKLHYIYKESKHANIQLYELAIPNSEKKYPYVHGSPMPIINCENYKGIEPAKLRDKVEQRLKNDLFFIGICENLSESLIVLYEKLGISKIKLWTPGLYSYKKLTFEEAPNNVKDLVLNLCQEDLEFYKKQRNNLERSISESNNKQVISSYVLENKRPDLKFVQGIYERLQLASANNDKKNMRLIKEISYWFEINQHIEKLIQEYDSKF